MAIAYKLLRKKGDKLFPLYVLSNEEVPVGVWHNSESLEHGTVIFEAKDGAYEPLSDDDILRK